MGFRVLGTNHTSFTVSSLDRSVGFFRDCLKFKLISRAPRDPAVVQKITGVEGADMEIAFLQGPGHTVELIEYKAPPNYPAASCPMCAANVPITSF